jgi:hypothetical protein
VLHSAELVIENIGETTINRLEIIIHWYDAQGKEIFAELWVIIHENYVLLKPGDKIPVYAVLTLKKEQSPVHHYELEIISIGL